MVEKLTRDRAGMRQTVALFTTMRAPVPESVRPGVAQLPDLTSLRHAPQALNLPQPSVELVPTRENAGHQNCQHNRTSRLFSGRVETLRVCK
jgi:hypothetical protein